MTNTVLHVLPHPGGGGETYVDALEAMGGFEFERVFLAPDSQPTRSVAPAAIRAQLTARKFDLLHVHGEVAAAVCLPAIGLRRSIVTLHGLHLLRRLQGWRRGLAAQNLRLVIRAATVTICVGEAELADLVATVGSKAGVRAVVIHNGVDQATPVSESERAAARAELGIPSHLTVGAFVGSLDERKDPMTVVRAAALLGEEGMPLVLALAGDGPLRDELEHLTAETGSVRLLGFRRDVRRVLASADFVVLPSRREGLSYALLEAMALGLPVVASDAPGNPEAVGSAGIVVPRGDVMGFAAAFRNLLDPGLRTKLGERARQRSVDAFSRDEMVRRTREVYEQAIARSRVSGDAAAATHGKEPSGTSD
jgi:glycosyltransferase involved in cell wall biosynthesis